MHHAASASNISNMAMRSHESLSNSARIHEHGIAEVAMGPRSFLPLIFIVGELGLARFVMQAFRP